MKKHEVRIFLDIFPRRMKWVKSFEALDTSDLSQQIRKE